MMLRTWLSGWLLFGVAAVGAGGALAGGMEPLGGGFPGGSEEEKGVFLKEVWPLLESKCIECHGPEKQKAGLRLDTREGLFEGDEGWIPVVAGKVSESYMMERVGLPDGDSERMPPKGDRLSEAQVGVLTRWIEAGAPFEDPPEIGPSEDEKAYEVGPLTDAQRAAIAETTGRLDGLGIRALAVAQGMDAVEVNLSLMGDRAKGETVEQLVGLAPVLVHLNLSRTPVGDGELEVIGGFEELRHLNLARTQVTDAGLGKLAKLKKLRYLNLYGTGIGDEGLAALGELPELRRLFLWQTQVTDRGVAALRMRMPNVAVIQGTELVAPAKEGAGEEKGAEKAKPAALVNTECPVSGAAVDAGQVVEHEGRRIGFCCGKCKAAFEKDPAKFLPKLGLEKQADAGEKAKPAALVNKACPVSGADVDAAQVVEHAGKRIGFCCGNCKGAFEKEPSKYLAKLGLDKK